jgi:hypothetical protein
MRKLRNLRKLSIICSAHASQAWCLYTGQLSSRKCANQPFRGLILHCMIRANVRVLVTYNQVTSGDEHVDDVRVDMRLCVPVVFYLAPTTVIQAATTKPEACTLNLSVPCTLKHSRTAEDPDTHRQTKSASYKNTIYSHHHQGSPCRAHSSI